MKSSPHRKLLIGGLLFPLLCLAGLTGVNWLSRAATLNTGAKSKFTANALPEPLAPATSFCNNSGVTINTSASVPTAASPYPSTINVSGLSGTISKVTLTLNNLNHPFPDDIDILLVGPSGEKALVFSDVGGSSCANCPVTLVLDDAAAGTLPNSNIPTPLASGTFKTANYNGGDTDAFPAPAPAPDSNTLLSVFNGTSPNGTWSLYIVDDGAANAGTLGGWCLDITSGAGPCSITPPSNITLAKDPNFCGVVVTYAAPTTTGSCGSITCNPPSGYAFPLGITTVTCSEASPGSATATFTVNVTGSCATGQICDYSGVTINTGGSPTAASPYPATMTVSGLSGTITKVTITLTNLNHQFPDDLDILLVGPTGAQALIFSDVGSSTCSNCPVTLTLDDAAALALPNSTELSTGIFQPANYNGGDTDTFPAPAPALGANTALSAFNGTNPNGTWSLYVVDDGATIAGTLGGWCLNITSGAGPCSITPPANVIQAKDPNFCGAVVTYASPMTTGSCGSITCSPSSGSSFPLGVTTVTCSEASPGSATAMFTVNVTGSCAVGQACNNSPITIAGSAGSVNPAAPYPSTINISGVVQAISKVTVTLSNFSHSLPDDVDILLVGPQGQKALLWSDVGGGAANAISSIHPVTITLDDAAAQFLPDSTLLSTGSFKPQNYNGGDMDTFPAPAPAPDANTALSVFNGTNANGIWSLYVVSDAGITGDSGAVAGGWCLNIVQAPNMPPTITAVGASRTEGNPGSNSTIANVNDSEFPLSNLAVTVNGGAMATVNGVTVSNISVNSAGVVTANVVAACGATNASFTLRVTDSGNLFAEDTLIVIVIRESIPPIIAACPTNITIGAMPNSCAATVTYTPPTATDNCGVATVTCLPASGSSFSVGTTTVTCTASDLSPNSPDTSCSFTVTVQDTQAPTIAACPANISVSSNVPTAVTYTPPSATDNCGSATVNCVPVSGTIFPIGTTTVTCTASDTSPNSSDSSCSFTVMVVPCSITCPANVTSWTSTSSTLVNYPAPTTTGSCGTVTCTPASGSSFAVGTTTVSCSTTAGPSCSFTVTVNRLALGASIDDPLACAGPGDKVNGSFSATNTSGSSATVSVSATLSNISYLPGSATADQPGAVVVLSNVISWTGMLGSGQTVNVNWMGQISDTLQPSGQACSTTTATANGLPVFGNVAACITLNCPAPGPGGIFPAISDAGDQNAGSVLIYNIYTSGASSGNTQNTRINITNAHPTRSSFVHLFFVAEGCSIADSYICLTGSQTASFLASDFDPGTTGYLVAVAVNAIGCPTSHNFLIGDEYVKFTSGHAANLGAIAFSQLAGGLLGCDGNSVTATLNFDGVSYNRVPAVLALDNVGSRADGNDTLVIINRIGGNLGIGAATLGTLFGIMYDDAENSLSFSVSGNCQLRNSISNNFPRTTPRFETFVPAGRTGWAKIFNQTGAIGITGAAINFNANAGASAGAFNQGHNLHHLTLNANSSYIIPVFPPSC